ncbi:MAG: hypothetical protein ACE149_18545 [Armatimonadota bacterium]
MSATTLRIASEETEVVGTTTALREVAVREEAAERLMREMDRAARVYERMGKQLGRALDSDRARRQTAWRRGTRQRA